MQKEEVKVEQKAQAMLMQKEEVKVEPSKQNDNTKGE